MEEILCLEKRCYAEEGVVSMKIKLGKKRSELYPAKSHEIVNAIVNL
jgi:hypothetical protein